MKTTKTIEINTCDSCGKEASVVACPKCGKEVCCACCESFSVHSWRGDNGATASLDARSFCYQCSPAIFASIVALGFVVRPVPPLKPEPATT